MSTLILKLFYFLILLLMILLSIAFFTLVERKILSLMHNRLGPNKNLFIGLIQPVLDGLKLFNKDLIKIDKTLLVFFMGPIFSFFLSFMVWTIFFLPSLKNKILFFFIIMGLNSYIFIITGWSSYSKFSYLGGIRASSQSISYEICLTILVIISIIMFSNLSLVSFNEKFFLFNFFLLLIWMLIILIETNRAPFDFSEGESELISGFNTEYGSLGFVLFMLSEYSMMIFFSLFVSSILYCNVFLILIIFFIISRSSFPRFRYDFLMNLMWFKLLPFTCFLLLFFIII